MANQEEKVKVNLSLLKELANKKAANEASKKIESIIESLHDRQDFAHYHYHVFKNIISEVNTDLAKIEMAFGMNDDDRRNKIAIKAHVSACIQSIHITHDVLAYLIATVLSLELNEREITFLKVQEKVKKFEHLKNLMSEFSNHFDYIYLVSYVNHTKHRYHIQPKITYHFVGDNHYTARFESFTFKGNDYPEQEIEDFLIREYNREQLIIIKIENELINILES